MNSQFYSYSATSSMFYDGKKRIVSQNQSSKKKINNNPIKSKQSFLRLFQNKNNIKGKMGTKQNNNQWKIVNIKKNSKKKSKKKAKKKLKKKPNSLKKRGKIQKS